ncbi:TonB-dependent receptor domain-containing protein [Parapedobacter deserti]|uniref:TonB-dependent receptor domain-containing protein n=1 Tax=Parapedobacter deserti TaxID=1912957 RepID=A0ABV7JS35_9SPHI
MNNCIKPFLTTTTCLIICLSTIAQTGIIRGIVRDSRTSDVIVGATVGILGTTRGGITDNLGQFVLADVPVGEYVIKVTYVGYIGTQIEGVVVKSDLETVLEIQLDEGGELMDEVVITTTRTRGSDITLLAEQKRSAMVIQRIGTQELSRKGVSDAATAVTKMSGVSKDDVGNQVYIRGMGDRYNATSLNGLPLPSNNPSLKNIALDLFSTDIVEFISVDKTYNSRMSGDFGGGSVDIYSKDYSGRGLLEVSVSSTLNSNALSRAGDFRLFPGGNRWGFSEYAIPENPLSGFNFANSANPVARNPYPANVRLLGGKSFNLGSEGRFSFFATAGFGNSYDYREGVNRDVNAQGARRRWTDQERFGYQTNATGLLNLTFQINPKHRLSNNVLFVNSSDQLNERFDGYFVDITESGTGLKQLGSYAQNRLLVEQLLGKHQLSDRIDVDWGVSISQVDYFMPDRIQSMLRRQGGGEFIIAQNTTTDNNRFNQKLKEREYALNVSASYRLGDLDAPKGYLHVGYQGREKNRDFESVQFNFNHRNREEVLVDPNNLDAYYNQANFAAGLFDFTGFAGTAPQTYNGEQSIHAGYVNLEYNLTDRLTGVLGVRYEHIKQFVEWVTILDPGNESSFSRSPVLPNLNLKYELDNKQNLRLAASKTYTIPQFKERAPFVYDDGTIVSYGNPYLYPSDNYNFDLKWELFPTAAELISITAFGKYIQSPINEVNVAATANDISWVNIGDAGTVFGAELELRKDIYQWNDDRNEFSGGLNVAYMKTRQDLNRDKVAKETNFNINTTYDESSFAGASDLLVNADLTFTNRWRNGRNIMATVAYSYFSDKVYALGIEQKGNLVDRGVGTLDVIIRSKITPKVGVDLLFRNLLNPEYRRVQENATGHVPVLTYKKGQYISLGLSYRI